METILLIYNDETFSQTLQQFFSAQGYVVKYVQDAELAEEYAVQQKPDIIILDALLQKMNGFELCTRLKNNPLLKATPIIMMSAIYISDDDLKTGIQLGTTLYPIRADRC